MGGATLTVWPRSEAISEALARALEPGQAVVPRGRDVTWDELRDELSRELRPLDRVTTRLALRFACLRGSAGSDFAGIAGTRGFVASAARFVNEVERAAIAPEDLARAAAAIPGSAGERARVLARIQGRFRESTARLGFLPGARQAHATRVLRGQAEPASPGPVVSPLLASGEVVLEPGFRWDPADVETMLALAEHLGRRGGRLRLRVPWAPARPGIFGGLEPVLSRVESRIELEGLELDFQDPATQAVPTIGRILRALGTDEAEAVPRGDDGPSPLTIVAAPSVRAELRAIAARARALVDSGTAPEQIVVTARRPGTVSGLLAEELARVRLRLDDRRGPPLSSAPPARLVLALLEIGARGFAREDVLALLTSRYVEGTVKTESGRVWAHEIARAARELGVRELSPSETRGEGLARLAGSTRLGDHGPTVGARLRRLLAPIAALPAEGTITAHTLALAAAVATLEIDRRARYRPAGDAAPQLDEEEPDVTDAVEGLVERALARDQAAMDAIGQLLGALPLAARACGVDGERLTRAAYAALLLDVMTETPLRAIGARGGAVRLLPFEELASRRFEHVIVARLVEGVAPERASDDGIFGERERRALNGALGRRAFPTVPSPPVMGTGKKAAKASPSGPSVDDAPPLESTAFERLLLCGAMASATRSVTLTYAVTDDERAVLRSPFVDELLRVAPWVPKHDVPHSPVAPLADARGAADFLARAALEALADPAGRLVPTHKPQARPGALWSAAARALATRARRVHALAVIERHRWGFFLGAEPAGPHVGGVAQVPSLLRRIGGGAETPLAARRFDTYANCPFTFFAGQVLGVESATESEDAPDARLLGVLLHAGLESFYRRRQDAGCLPVRGDDEDRAALEAACAEVFADAEAKGHRGHPALWELTRARVFDDLWRWIRHEAAEGAPGEGVPRWFELPFGAREGSPDAARALPALVCGSGAEAVHVGGRIDRVDLKPGRSGLVVLDYKLGARASQMAKLREEELLVTQLQLGIYAAAARAGLAARGEVASDVPVDAAYVSLRDGEATRTVGESLPEEERTSWLEGRLTTRVVELTRGMRAGQFPVNPVSCRSCDYRTACRVVALAGEEDEA